MRVLALRHARPASWVWWALGGAVAGATLPVPLVLRPADFRVGGTAESAPDDDRPEADAAHHVDPDETAAPPQAHWAARGRDGPHETAPTEPARPSATPDPSRWAPEE